MPRLSVGGEGSGSNVSGVLGGVGRRGQSGRGGDEDIRL